MNCMNQDPRQSFTESSNVSHIQGNTDVKEPEDMSDSDDVPLSIIQDKLKNKREPEQQKHELFEDISEDDSYEDESYIPSSDASSSEGDCSPPFKRKKKWVRKRIRPFKREENRKRMLKEISDSSSGLLRNKTPIMTRKDMQKKTKQFKQQQQYNQHLKKALKQSKADHTLQTILKRSGEARLSNLLTSNSLKRITVNADGDCYFNAVRIQLSTDYTVQELRNKLSSHLLERKEHYKAFVQHRKGMSCDEFSKMYDSKVKDIRKEGIWNVDLADLLPLATANCFNVNITIYSSRLNHPVIEISPDINILEDDSARKDVRLTYLAVRGYEHYDACIRRTVSDPQPSSNTNDDKPSTPQKCQSDRNISTITPRKQAVYISPKKTKLSRKRTPNVTMWKKNIRKRNKTTGKSYISPKSKKIIEAKQIGQGCKSCRYKCTEKFTEEVRQAIFNTYYDGNMTYERQIDFICQHIDVCPTSKRYAQTYKHNSRTYFLPSGKERVRVCKQFFMRTLCVGDKLIRYTLSKKQHSGFAGADKRGKHTPSNKTDDTRKQYIKKHIESFPVVESHYTRKSTKRKYLSQDLTIRKMYDLYKIKCEEDNNRAVSEMVYRKIFCSEYNLSFHKPKKDLCQTCNKYNKKKKTNSTTTEDEENFKAHIDRKERARDEKEKDKQTAKDYNSLYVATFDLEAVLSTPCSTVSQVYYKRKLNCYNLTFFSLSDKKGTCYIWDETHGQRGSSEIGTCVLTHIMSLPSVVQHVILYSDCCSGQNRNQYLTGGLLHTVIQHPYVQVIEQKFLESGHTQMECDAMHSSIEHAKKSTSIYVPDQWDTVIHMARRQKPYTVIPMRFDSFYDLKTHTESNYKNFKTDIQGNRVNWLKVKVLKVTKEFPDEIQIKYEYDEEFRKINVTRSVRGRPPAIARDLPKYGGKLPISEAKKKDLLDLCDSLVIPAIYRGFYESLPTSKSAKDQLALPDINDEDSDSSVGD